MYLRLVLLSFIAFMVSSCTDEQKPNPCGDPLCSGHGNCVLSEGEYECRCDDDYVNDPRDRYKCISDSCIGIDCGPGVCEMNAAFEPSCNCHQGYILDPGPPPYCLPKGGPVGMGLLCKYSVDCESKFCLVFMGEEEGYCSKRDCRSNAECANYSSDGREMCCEDIDGQFTCLKVGEGCQCGDKSGSCGTSCTCQSNTACAPGHVCIARRSWGLNDPLAFCAKPCEEDYDCSDCLFEYDTDESFRCDYVGNGQSLCMTLGPDPGGCYHSIDCAPDEVCVPFPSDSGDELYGMCATLGEQQTGSDCDDSIDPNTLPVAERCVGIYCINDHCSERCEADSDCVGNMVCGLHPFDLGAGGIAEVGMCLWFNGSLAPCTQNADCEAGEECYEYEDPEDQVHKICVIP